MARRPRLDDDDWDDEPGGDVVGSHDRNDCDPGRPKCVLWVPDIDARHKWREYYIYPEAKPGRPLGFRGPKG